MKKRPCAQLQMVYNNWHSHKNSVNEKINVSKGYVSKAKGQIKW